MIFGIEVGISEMSNKILTTIDSANNVMKVFALNFCSMVLT